MQHAKTVIAIIDVDVAIVDLLRDVLTDAGYQTVSCRDVVDVAMLIQRERPDLILFDLSVRHIAIEWDVLTLLRRVPASAAIPVIVYSSDTRLLRDRQPQLQALCCETLAKPFDLDELLAKVDACLCAASGSAK